MTSTAITSTHSNHPDTTLDKGVFGFWIYIMSDCILFATLFATYVVLKPMTFGGPGIKQIAELPYVLGETMALLASNFTFGLAILNAYKKKQRHLTFWLFATILLGGTFVAMELHEFAGLVAAGHSWQQSAFLSAFFTLVGTHGLHVTIGLIWIAFMIIQVNKFGLNTLTSRRLVYLGLFWNFLDIVWIFVFSIVYLMGAV